MPKRKSNRVWMYLGAGFILVLSLASILAVYYLPFFQNIIDIGKLFEWIGICLVGVLALVGVWTIIRRRMENTTFETDWNNTPYVPERLTNVKLEQMVRIERQFVLYGQNMGLLVMLVTLLQRNRVSEDAIASTVQPLLDLPERNTNQLESRFIGKRQIKEREQFLETWFTTLPFNGERIKTMPTMTTVLDLPKSKCAITSHEKTVSIVRKILELEKQGYRQEDIVEGLPSIIKNPEAQYLTLLGVKPDVPKSNVNSEDKSRR